MRIAIDSREALNVRKTGKGQWAYRFLRELQKRDVKLTLLASSHLKTAWTLLHIKPDLYVSPTSYIIPALIGRWIPCAIVIHDLIAFRKEPHDLKAKCIERLTLRWALKHAMHICTVSEATKRDLLERFPWIDPRKVAVIYAGPSFEDPCPLFALRGCFAAPQCDTRGRDPPAVATPLCQGYEGREAMAGRQDDIFTILCIGTLCPRKNQLRLIEAFEKVCAWYSPLSRYPSLEGGDEGEGVKSKSPPSVSPPLRGSTPQLLLAGSRGWHDEEIVFKAKSTPGVTWLGHVSDDQYRELLASATVFALPSLYEGFGLPILDAMTMGIPVLTSDRGSLKEVAGRAAIFVDPENRDSIAHGLQKLLTDSHLREELCQKGKERAAGFSWERTVDLFLKDLLL